jgi:Zn-dependent protease with chaperone function
MTHPPIEERVKALRLNVDALKEVLPLEVEA